MVEIFHSLVYGFTMLFNPVTFALMLIGIGIGFVVGILPGLGGPTALALMLPFIFKMTAAEAFAFLLGMTSVTTTTGEITSILFGVPGEPTTAATILDGHPMAKKGEAGCALGAALMASLVGAIIGAFALGISIPVVRPIVLSFSSPEFFMVAILGISFVSALSGENMLRGLIAGGAGLFLATIGLDPMSGQQRFTFNQLFLWDGIGLVPISVGFFAIPEIIDLAVKGSSIAGKHDIKLGGILEGVKDVFRHWLLVIRCSAIGTFIGIMPGIGAATSQWLAYAHAVQSSPDKEGFGKGAVEGVLGPCSADNSSLGGSLIPTIAFGVPGSVMMAILLGAFIMQGLVPGPDMLIPEAGGGYLGLTFSFMWTIVITNIITVVICFLFLKQLVKVTEVRGNLLIPVILILIYLGAFAEKNIFADMPMVLLFGTLGWIMVNLHWPRPPLILGLVLGPLAENRLFLSVDNYGTSWLGRPIVLTLIVMTIGPIFYMAVTAFLKRRKLPPVSESAATSRRGLQLSWHVAFASFVVIMFAAALWQSRNFSLRPGLFPWVIGIPVLFMAMIELTFSLLGRNSVALPDDEGNDLPPELIKQRTIHIFSWIIGFFLAIWFLGFNLASPLAAFLHLKYEGKENWLVTLTMTGGISLFIYILFDRLLHVPFPPGLILQWLGL